MHRVLLSATVLALLLGCESAPTAPETPGSRPAFSTFAGSLSFTNTPLPRPDGSSEPSMSIARNGIMAMDALSLGLASDRRFGTNLWTGPFGATPTFRGIIDAALQQPGRVEFGGEDADVNFGSTGTLHLTTLIFLGNPTLRTGQLGVSAIACRNAASTFSRRSCHAQIIDLTQWTSSDGGVCSSRITTLGTVR
jgi:hypothetical protein